METKNTNHLANATSPYLQQHADNPVDWWPWCDEALQLACDQDKPILLSIGYSACHWCHVMAHESFEDPATAELMNRLFVNIKVDREERPDLDKIYQAAHQLLAQRAGGWPLTVFLMPQDRMPFFAGTYFPREPKHRLPAFKHLLAQVERAYREQGEAIVQQNDALAQALARLEPPPATGEVMLDEAPILAARQQLGRHFDADNGGFGSAPKFPHPSNLEFLLRYGHLRQDPEATRMACFTLERMANGGMNDLLGGGFCRYSVDDAWMIPHFEKMLYDNGPLLALYADAWQATGNENFRQTCEQTAGWVMREMQSAEGGYYASLDADSEGEEGRFYVWDREQVRGLLSEEEYAVFAPAYGLNLPPNFEGRWHLHGYRDLPELGGNLGLDETILRQRLTSARDKLLAERDSRIRPGRDDKILTAWNALMIKGMARAGRLLGRPDWIDSACRALDFIRQQLWRDGRLLATYRDGHANLPAYLDDHAYLIAACLELLQARWRTVDLDFACALADLLLDRFEDPQQGGFFFTADDHEHLIHRPKPYSDEAIPAGNGIAVCALQRLAHLSGDLRYAEAAERAIKAGWGPLSQLPYAHPSLLIGLEEALNPAETLILRADGAELGHWQEALSADYAPNRCAYAIDTKINGLPDILSERRKLDGPTVYLCRGHSCLPPMQELEKVLQILAIDP